MSFRQARPGSERIAHGCEKTAAVSIRVRKWKPEQSDPLCCLYEARFPPYPRPTTVNRADRIPTTDNRLDLIKSIVNFLLSQPTTGMVFGDS